MAKKKPRHASGKADNRPVRTLRAPWTIGFFTPGPNVADQITFFPNAQLPKSRVFPHLARTCDFLQQSPELKLMSFGFIQLEGMTSVQVKGIRRRPSQDDLNQLFPDEPTSALLEYLGNVFRKLSARRSQDFFESTFRSQLSRTYDPALCVQLVVNVCRLDLTSSLARAILQPTLPPTFDESVPPKRNMEQKEAIESAFALRVADLRDQLPLLADERFRAAYREGLRQNAVWHQTQSVAAFQEFISSGANLTGAELVEHAEKVQAGCSRFQCVLRFRSGMQEAPTLESTFTLKAGSLKTGRPPVVVCASLATKLPKGERLAVFPDFVAVPIDHLDPKIVEAAFARWFGALRAKQISELGRASLSKAQLKKAAKKGGAARTDALSPEQRRDLAARASRRRNM